MEFSEATAWGKAVETLHSRQIDLKERAAAANDRCLDEGGRETPQQTGGPCGTPEHSSARIIA
jgi:hypothetical protein